MTNLPTGWHPDPDDPYRERWWDNASGQWLDHTREVGKPPPGTSSPGQPPQWMQSPPTTTPSSSPSGQRWAQIRALFKGPLILLLICVWPLVILYLMPWELWWKKFRALPQRTQVITGVVVLVVLVVLGAIGGISENAAKKEDTASASKDSTTAATSASSQTATPPPATTEFKPATPDPPPPPTYPGARDNDAVANDRGEVEVRGLTTTIGPLRRIPATDFDADRLCVDLTFQNRGSDTEYYDSSDFSIQYPSGNEKGTLLVYSDDVRNGNLVPGGQTSGQVCFNDREEVGQHLVLWNRTDFSFSGKPRRGVWILS